MKMSNPLYQFDNTLSLPEIPELQQRLREKLDEYNNRIENYKKKYRVKKRDVIIDRESNMLDAIYKSEILTDLLENGQADLRKIHDRLYKEFNDYVSEESFINAVTVITDYINTGGRHTHGGSGFFTDDMFKRLLEASAILDYPESAGQQGRLKEKYFEFVGRNTDYEKKADATIDRTAMKRNSYKMKILARLQEKHRLFVEDLARELLAEEGKAFDKMEFYNALSQIQLLLKRLTIAGN
jgi:hypothetical protein